MDLLPAEGSLVGELAPREHPAPHLADRQHGLGGPGDICGSGCAAGGRGSVVGVLGRQAEAGCNTPPPNRTFPDNPLERDGAMIRAGPRGSSPLKAGLPWRLTSGMWRQGLFPPLPVMQAGAGHYLGDGTDNGGASQAWAGQR